MKLDPANNAMEGYWDHQVEDNLPMKALLILAMRNAALKWIDKNLPEAFFRPMFTGELD
jgi:hypothetical protein